MAKKRFWDTEVGGIVKEEGTGFLRGLLGWGKERLFGSSGNSEGGSSGNYQPYTPPSQSYKTETSNNVMYWFFGGFG